MRNNNNSGGTCKAVCWAIGLFFGGYLAFILVTDFGQDMLQSAVLGIVALLVVGLLLRRIFCHGSGNKLKDRIREAADRKATTTAPVKRAKTPRPAPQSLAVSQAADDAAAVLADMEAENAAASAETAAEPETRFEQPRPDNLAAKMDESSLKDAEAVAQAEDTLVMENPVVPAPVVEEQPQTIAPKAQETADPTREAPEPEAKEKPQFDPIKPRGLEAPEAAGADDLRQIKGVGAEIQKALNDVGIYHFSQIVSMNRKEMAWLDQNMPGADGSASRDRWKKQCRVLMTGEDTEFSKRVKDGEVY